MIHLALTDRNKKKTIDTILVSPLDFHGYLIDLPPLKSEHQEGAVRFQLRTLHPGDPGDTSIDFWMSQNQSRMFSRSGGKVVAFAVNQEDIRIYQQEKLPLIPGIAILSAAAKTAGSGMKLGLLSGEGWIEGALFHNDELLITAAVDPVKVTDWIQRLAHFPDFPKAENLTVFLVSVNSDQETLNSLSKKIDGVGKGTPLHIDLKKTLENLSPFYDCIFSKTKKHNKISRKRIVAALLVFNLFAASTCLYRFADKEEAQLSILKKAYEEKKRNASEIEKISAQIKALETNNTSLKTNQPSAPYLVISEITSNLHGGWIRSIVIKDNTFQMEIEGTDSLAVLESLHVSNYFKDVSLHQAIPSPIKGEIFSISGYIHNDNK